MKAWICRAYGGPDVLALEDRPTPVPKAGEILIRIRATTVASGDVRVRALSMPRGFGLIARAVFGFTRPRQPILGTDLAGTVEAVGRGVTAWKPGDAVIGFPGGGMRCHAEYRVMATDGPVAPKPANLGFEEAASLCFGGMTALHFLRKAALKAGERVLVIGASGAVGSAMVQLATHMGATVTAVTSAGNADLARALGAVAVIDYARRDFTREDETYDVIADTVGASTFAACHPRLNEGGRYLAVSADLPALFARPVGTKRSVGGPAAERREDVAELARLAEAGVLKPVIDGIHPFDRLPEAHARAGTGRKRGSVVVSMAG
ncbi:NAD(P)-dependent alcohol dehydrogenase [Azospirillum sp.]|uniref:NAD(P)-dependent alcohol dehydrogenase n=1 Tax=Azospirillum sp. TaxID=34012 RepID=UPI002D2BC78C|nr:NAD(P)-dependent alcohol dehydrogenase [Azospirillum sp.]HYD68673.1 NAD(P)-dependent alcohol dehydrogenase [Azospirillum sp.]